MIEAVPVTDLVESTKLATHYGENTAMRAAESPDRVFLDEDSANELDSEQFALRQVGACRLKGFSGFRRVYQLDWAEKP